MSTVLIVGASRGIGYETVKFALKAGTGVVVVGAIWWAPGKPGAASLVGFSTGSIFLAAANQLRLT